MNMSEQFNSPLLNCSAGTTPIVNTTAPYCVLPGGAQRLDYCCSDRGSAAYPINNNTPGLVPDCYLWCELVFDGQGDIDTQFRKALNAFSSCLTTGVNASRSLGGMACSKGLSNNESDDSGGNTTNQTSSMEDSDDAPVDMPGAGSSNSANLKLVAFTGALLIAGIAVGGL